MKGHLLKFVVLFFTISLIKCGKTDEITLKSLITLSVDGASKEIVPGTALLTFETENDHQGRSLTISATIGGDAFSIAIANWDFQNPPQNGIKIKSYNNVFANTEAEGTECLSLEDGITKLCDNGSVTIVHDNIVYMTAYYSGNYHGFVKVTACDPSKKTISGEYDVKVGDGDGAELTLKGKFENISYTVLL